MPMISSKQYNIPTWQIKTGGLVVLEIAIVFAIFYVFGAWPVPDSNEPYYVGKAIHFWQPQWIPNDPFLESRDSHWTFYLAFGWLSFFLSPAGMAWTGRIVSWLLMAWSWRRLSVALLPVRWMSILTALALAYYVDSFHMAGEWIFGGIEGKSFAFPFLFLGLESMVRGRWHRTWIFLGIASAFHVLVGGWSVLVALLVWLTCDAGRFVSRARVRIPWGLFLGGGIALLGLVPAFLLDYGAPKDIVREAHQIYVFDRIGHHLVPYRFPWTFVARFFLLAIIWFLLCRFEPAGNRKRRRFDRFVWGALLLALIGMGFAYGLRDNKTLSAEILRFYWFRLSDIALPMGVALGGVARFLPWVKNLEKGLARQTLPSFTDGLILLGVPFGFYLLADHLVFGRFFFSWNLAPEPAVPWALTLIAGFLLLSRLQKNPAVVSRRSWGFALLYGALLLYAPFDGLKNLGDQRTRFAYSRIEPGPSRMAYYWVDVCRWISDPENTPPDARFWVPHVRSTFKWHARRSDVGVFKDIPQDAESIVAWHRAMTELFSYRDEEGNLRWDRSLTIQLWWKKPDELEHLRARYGFDYILCGSYPTLEHQKALELVYENECYRVYHVSQLSENTETGNGNELK